MNAFKMTGFTKSGDTLAPIPKPEALTGSNYLAKGFLEPEDGFLLLPPEDVLNVPPLDSISSEPAYVIEGVISTLYKAHSSDSEIPVFPQTSSIYVGMPVDVLEATFRQTQTLEVGVLTYGRSNQFSAVALNPDFAVKNQSFFENHIGSEFRALYDPNTQELSDIILTE